MNIFTLMGTIMIDDKDAKNSISKIGDNAESFGQKLDKGIKTAGKWGAVVAGAAVAAGTALVAMANNAGKNADRLLDLEAAVGMNVQRIQEWEYISKLAGTSQEAVTSAAEKLTKQLHSLENETGKSSVALDRLGLTFEELEGATVDQRMDMVIAALAGVEDPAERARLGTELLGGSWGDIAPIVSMGTDAIEEARQKAYELGAVMSEDSLNGANEFRMSMVELTTTFSSFFNQIGTKVAPVLKDTLMPIVQDQLMPAIMNLTEKVIGWIDRFANLDERTQKIILTIGAAVVGLGAFLAVLSPIIATIGTLITTVRALGAALLALNANPVGAIIMGITALIAAGVLLYKNWDTVKEKAQSIWNSIVEVIRGPANKILGFANAIIGAYEKMLNAVAKVINAIPAINIPSWVPGFGGSSFSIPKIPEINLPKIPGLFKGSVVESKKIKGEKIKFTLPKLPRLVVTS